MSDRRSLAFLHTASVHAETFGALMDKLAPEVMVHHLADQTLLDDAMAEGRVTEPIADRLDARLTELTGSGADLIVCTCSTIGGAAELVGTRAGITVLRIDRAMAERAVETGQRILVVACIETTIGPTLQLLGEVAESLGAEPDITTKVIEGAWERFLDGDVAGYYRTIAKALRTLSDVADVVVLAQASMAPAVDQCEGLDVPILSSPELGLRKALKVLYSTP